MTNEIERPRWEFDAIELIRDEFMQVGISMPRMGGNRDLWISVYAIAYGFNEICLEFNDRIEMVLSFEDNSLSYQIECRDDRNMKRYKTILDAASNGDIQSILNGTALPDVKNLIDIDHEKNIKIITLLSDGNEELSSEFMAMAGEGSRFGEQFIAPEKPKEGITISKLPSGSVD